MYTARATPLGKLKSYHAELQSLYRAALARREYGAARAIYLRRNRVKRAIVLAQEFEPTGNPALN